MHTARALLLAQTHTLFSRAQEATSSLRVSVRIEFASAGRDSLAACVESEFAPAIVIESAALLTNLVSSVLLRISAFGPV